MRRKRLTAVLAAILAGMLLVPAWGTPAQAADEEYCDTKSGTYLDGKLIAMCLEIVTYIDNNYNNAFYTNSSVIFGPQATSATGCKITMYATLDKAGSNTWQSSKVTQSCTYALTHRSTYVHNRHNESGTSATTIKARGCIDLYYNNSSSSGWQWCSDTPWIEWD